MFCENNWKIYLNFATEPVTCCAAYWSSFWNSYGIVLVLPALCWLFPGITWLYWTVCSARLLCIFCAQRGVVNDVESLFRKCPPVRVFVLHWIYLYAMLIVLSSYKVRIMVCFLRVSQYLFYFCSWTRSFVISTWWWRLHHVKKQTLSVQTVQTVGGIGNREGKRRPLWYLKEISWFAESYILCVLYRNEVTTAPAEPSK